MDSDTGYLKGRESTVDAVSMKAAKSSSKLPKLKLDHSNSDFSKLIVKQSVLELQTQRHQNQLNPSPIEFKSRTQSTVGRAARRETNPTSLRTLSYNITSKREIGDHYCLLTPRPPPKVQLDHRLTSEYRRTTNWRRTFARPLPDTVILSDHHMISYFRRTTKLRLDFCRTTA
ncbi:hypothetical protein M5K25_015024 [Dendrobium thyrsiflorum]|uniref:Uncharacterized protein n=1 Tax=Dendrobium thyrsiflorum TaxID=117978 RepID=A0ABD0UPA2_DENTH